MLRSCAKNKTSASIPPGLLPWQILLLFAVLSLFIPDAPLPSLCAGALLFAFFLKDRKNSLFWLTVLLISIFALFLAGFLKPEWRADPPAYLQKARNKVNIRARVHAVRPKPEDRLQIILKELEVQPAEDTQFQKLEGRVVWTWQGTKQWPAPGQMVQGRFRLKPIQGRQNFGTWDTRTYWARQKVRYRTYTKAEATEVSLHGPKNASWSFRLFLRNRILDSTQEGPGQGLLLALLMGDRSQTSYQTLGLVRRASLAHSLALSGLHVGFVVALAWGLAWISGKMFPAMFTRLPRQKWGILFAVPLILIYLWLGQAKPSLIRAALMFFFWGLLLLQGRKNIMADGLFLALLLILCLDPGSVHNLGTQLSFSAVAGIILVFPFLRDWIKHLPFTGRGSRTVKALLGILGISCIANLVLLPLIVTNFGEWSPHLYLNCFWLPLLGFCVLPLGLAGLAVSLIPGIMPCGEFLLFASGKLLDVMISVLELLEAGGSLEVLVPLRPLWPEAFGYWMFVCSLCIWRGQWRAWPKWIPVFGLLLLLGPGLLNTLENLQNKVSLRLLDVGQGQSVFLQAAKEKSMLIDGGGSWNKEYDLGRHILSPALTWGRSPQVDTVVLTHDDYDHLRGLFYILKHYRIQRFVFNGNWPQGWDGEHLKAILKKRNIPCRSVQTGDSLQLSETLQLQVLHPPAGYFADKDNDASLVLRLRHGRRGLAILPGDIENSGLTVLLGQKNSLQAEVLLLPHHGSRSSFNPAFYEQAAPDLGLVSCGYLNFFNFPHRQIRDYCIETDLPLFSTARHGQIAVTWNLSSQVRILRTKSGQESVDYSWSQRLEHWNFAAEYAKVP